jgi:hypothetical protein
LRPFERDNEKTTQKTTDRQGTLIKGIKGASL